MTSIKHINEILYFLYSEREKIESTGHMIDPDLTKTHHFINDEIQNLQMMLFEHEYHQFSKSLGKILNCSTEEENEIEL
jgi:hypothetical protein